jgi:hypothetical protein
MRKLTNLVLSMALAASVAGAAYADHHTGHGRSGHGPWNKWHSNSRNFAGAWYYPWVGPNWTMGGFQEPGTPFHGGAFTKTYTGEAVYVDEHRVQLKADGSGDLITFYITERETVFTPTQAAIHQGSKVRVTSDDRHRARWVHVIPFYKWLKDKTK